MKRIALLVWAIVSVMLVMAVVGLTAKVAEMNRIQHKTVDAIERGSFVTGLLTTNLETLDRRITALELTRPNR